MKTSHPAVVWGKERGLEHGWKSRLAGILHGGYSSIPLGMAVLLYLTHTGLEHQIWLSSRMFLGPVDMVSTMPVIGLPTPGESFFMAALSNRKSSTPSSLLPLWGHLWSGKKILFHCNNKAVVHIWASSTSRDPDIMHLVRSIFTVVPS